MMEIKQVGIIGCGAMGSGIAEVCARAGYQVVVREVNEGLLQKGMSAIEASFAKGVSKGRLSPQEKDVVLNRITGTTNTRDLYACGLVIEAVAENMELKKQIFTEMDKICPQDTILATNTSCLSIIDIAKTTNRPDKVLGMHFFNPAPIMRLLELVKTIATSDETMAIGREFGNSIGKTTIIAPDTTGFIVNRLFTPFQLSAIRMLEAGIATREDIDTGLIYGTNMPMGMLALSDIIGLDTTMDVAEAFYEQTKEAIFAPPTLLRRMVAAGWLGRKSGRGFYEYQ
ncbi:3-hydroxyacyl-CoA dehydrogenase family protein [Chloroflexota bacterium]